MPLGVGGAIAEGLRSGWQMGLESDAAQEHKREFDIESKRRQEGEDRLRKQEDDRYGRMQDAARVQAMEARQAALEKLAKDAATAGHPLDHNSPVMQERARLAVQLEDAQQQIATTGRLAPVGTGVTAPAPRPDASAMPTAPTAPPVDQGAVQAAVAAPVAPVAASPVGGTGLGPSRGPAGGAAPLDTSMGGDTASAPSPAIAGGAPAAAAVASPTTSAVTPAQKLVTDTDQHVQNIASKLHAGQMSFDDVAPGDFALMVASATKRPPGELAQVRQHVNDWQAGMQTGNNGLTIQGLNGIFGPQLAQGVGTPSAYGGTITGKSIVGLDPAASADGSIHTDKVIPRLQITTDLKGPDGQPLTYHAPLTQNRSTDPNDPVSAVSVGDAVNHVGALSTLVTAAAHPEVQAKLQEGAADPRVQAYLDAYQNQTDAANPAIVKENQIKAYMKAAGITDRDEAVSRMIDLGALPRPPMTKGVVAQTMDAAYQMVQDGSAPDLQTALRTLQATGVTKQPTKYSPGARIAVPGSGAPGAVGGTGQAISTSGVPLTGDQFLKTLGKEDQRLVQMVAADPSTAKDISMKDNQRAHIMTLVHQYNDAVQLGKGSPGVDAHGNPIGGISPQTVDFYATQSLAGDNSWQVGLARGQVGQRLISAVKDRIPQMASELGLSPQDVGTNKATNVALTKTLADRTKYVTAVQQLNGTLDRQAALVESLLAKGGATEGGPLFNAPYNKIREALGSVDAHNLDVALTGLAREHQRVLVGPMSNGQLAVSAQNTGDRLAGLNLSPSQIRGTIQVMRQEAQNGLAQGNETLSSIKGQLSALGKPQGGVGAALGAAPAAPAAPAGVPTRPGAAPAPAPAGSPVQIRDAAGYAALPPGAHYIDPNGVARIKQ
jgi:hypothetical protein